MTHLAGSELSMVVAKVLQEAPEWVRRDLASNDRASRTRAEDTLAAMIAAALGPHPG